MVQVYPLLMIVICSLPKEDVLTFKQKGKVVLLGDFNVGYVGKSSEVDDVIGKFWGRHL